MFSFIAAHFRKDRCYPPLHLALFALLPQLLVAQAENPGPAITHESEFFAQLDLARPDLTEVRDAVAAQNWPKAKEAWAHHLQARQSPRWIWSRRDKAALLAAFREKFDTTKWVAEADKIVARVFELQGVKKQLPTVPDWHGYKNEWGANLSSMHFLRPLAQAWWVTGDARYAGDFVFLLTHWVEENPLQDDVEKTWAAIGTPWRTLNTGIRAMEWWNSFELLMDAPEFDAQAKYLLSKSLVEHARRLYAHETRFNRGNWQAVECAGLAAIGIMLPESREAAAWRERASSYLAEHMQKDILPDGAHFELSAIYHTWVLDQYVDVALLMQRNGYTAPGLLDRHEKMFDFLLHLAKPDRRCPPLGDAARGTDIRPTMGVGALLYHRADFAALADRDISENWIWLFGADVSEQLANIKPSPPDPHSHLFPDTRIAVMRTGWQAEDRYLLLNAAPWGGGHNHLDRLEVVAYAGRDLLIDPGMCSYDLPASGKLRQSTAHNVLLIDVKDQPRPPEARLLAWQSSAEADFVSGTVAEANGMKHQRSVLFVRPDYWVVLDHVFPGHGDHLPHEITRLFHFPIGPASAENNAARTAFPDGTNIEVRDLSAAVLQLTESPVPTGEATFTNAKVASFVNKTTLPAMFATVLTPFAKKEEIPQATLIPSANPMVGKMRLKFADGREDEIAIAWEARDLHLGGHSSKGWALCIRHRPPGDQVIEIGANATLSK